MTNTVGAVPQNATRTPVYQGDEFAETTYFGPGLETNTEFMTAFPIGMEIGGTLVALRTIEAEPGSDDKDRHYACFKDAEGNKFRVQAPGQLWHSLNQVGLGATVAIKYLGKEEATIKGAKRKVHKFEVNRLN